MQGPSKLLLGLEGIRAVYEYGLSWALNVPLRFISAKGDGHPVIVIPGLGTADGSTHYVRRFLNDIGYETHTWGQGRNMGPKGGIDKFLSQLTDHVSDVVERSGGQQVSIIGWSLGGIYSREIAKVCPNLVRQVITLGTPFKTATEGTNAAALYEFLSKDKSHRDPEVLKKISMPPPVPFTSIYSKSDGVVHWECSLENEGPMCENIEIPGASHLGLGHNPMTMYVIANRLRYNKENWKPYNS